jgi:hypothetical protein
MRNIAVYVVELQKKNCNPQNMLEQGVVKRDVANDESDARKQDEMYLIILKNIHVDSRIKKLRLIFFGKKDP